MPCSLFHCTGSQTCIKYQEPCHSFDRMSCVFFLLHCSKGSGCRSQECQALCFLRFRSLWIMLICCHFVQHGRMRAVISVSSCCCVFRGESAVTAMHVAHTHTITNKLLRHLSLTFLIDKLKQSLLLSLTFLTLLSSVFVCV